VFIFGRDGRLLLQQRSQKKDTYPLHWECVGGHLSPGESYDAAAVREVVEELGIEPRDIEFLQKLTACAETGQEFIHVYRAVIDSEPQPHPDEVIALQWFTVDELRTEIAAQARPFSPSLLHSLDCTNLLGAS
jgi:isopentenyl-diphosphate Delta-isomerase